MWIIGHSIEKCWRVYRIAGDSIEFTPFLVIVGNALKDLMKITSIKNLDIFWRC